MPGCLLTVECYDYVYCFTGGTLTTLELVLIVVFSVIGGIGLISVGACFGIIVCCCCCSKWIIKYYER